MLIAVAVATWGYEPPSDDELAGHWESLSRTERIAELRKLDEIEHAVPKLEEPRIVVVQTSDGMIYAYPSGPLVIDIAGHLRYSITIPSATAPGTPRINPWPYFFTGVALGVTALAVGLVLR